MKFLICFASKPGATVTIRLSHGAPAIVIKSVQVTLVEQTDLSQCELKSDPRHPFRLREGAIDGNMSIAHLSKL